ncbi:DUF2927 domain-containing protein [Citreimonas sp.]|uniref:DUF2927 domain-containing protein n=1 Tax=Citreimonas sp. TaxID=3036715 RepID=UPI004057CFF1
MTGVRILAVLAAVALGACAQTPAGEFASRAGPRAVAPALPAMKSFTAPRPRASTASNDDIARDFLDLSFALESGNPLPRMTRFEGPITVRLTGASSPSIQTDLSRLLARLRTEAGIDIRQTRGSAAQITIQAVRRDDIRAALPEAACFVVPNISSLDEYFRVRGAERTRWSRLQRRERLAIFLPADASPQEARDCLHEELAQAIGPLNDLYRLPDSVFNDDNFHAVLTGYDMLILRVYHDAALSNGMTRAEAAARVPAILARLNPRGEGVAPRALPDTPRAWIDAIQRALGPGAGPVARRRAARDAVRIATDAGWTDHRRGFAHFALGRLIQRTDPAGAQRQFVLAMRHFGGGPETALHRAYAAAQLAGHELARGDGEAALAVLTPHLAIAAEVENAALLATLLLLRAEALEMTGRVSEARAVRLDSLGWARYGFGPDWAVRAKLREIGALPPQDRNRRNAS